MMVIRDQLWMLKNHPAYPVSQGTREIEYDMMKICSTYRVVKATIPESDMPDTTVGLSLDNVLGCFKTPGIRRWHCVRYKAVRDGRYSLIMELWHCN